MPAAEDIKQPGKIEAAQGKRKDIPACAKESDMK